MRRAGLGLSVICATAGLWQAQAQPKPARAESARPDWENALVFERNRESSRATLFNFEDEAAARTADPAKSRWFQSLDGIWKFQWSPSPDARPRDFYRPGFDVSKWADIAVPGNMEVQGYGEPLYINFGYVFPMQPPLVGQERNYVGSYRRTVDVPRAWDGKDIYIAFGAVSSALTLWVNGRQVGYSESSKDAARFRITDYVVPGRNEIAFEVLKFSDGSYLEDIDFWRLSGPERSVSLYAEPKGAVADYFARADVAPDGTTGVLALDVALTAGSVGGTVEPVLFDGTREIARMPRQEIRGAGVHRFSASVPGARLWSAETPSLYDLRMTVRDAKGRVVSVVPARIGFRSVRVDGNKLLVNGRRVTIRGTNLHEHSMVTGHVVDDALLERDIRLMKALNFNAIRTSHYPARPKLYELADRYGMYIVSEANIESHGNMVEGDRAADPSKIYLAHLPEWRAAHMARMQANVETHKNHPSVIAWSLGNEAGEGPTFQAMYDWTKRRDPTRPVQYQGAGLRPPYTDLIVPFYPSDAKIAELSRENPDKPIIMSEYAHAMGNSMGAFADSWAVIRSRPNTQGGFVWDWVDQGLLRKRDDGTSYLAYGGDFDPMLVRKYVKDEGRRGNFLANGIVGADRTPHPHAEEVKHAMQPVGFAMDLAEPGRIAVTNRFDFIDLDRFDLAWAVRDDGTTIAEGRVAIPSIAPGQRGQVQLPQIASALASAGGERFVDLRMLARGDSLPLIEAGHTVGWDQFAVAKPAPAPSRVATGHRTSPLSVERSDRSLTLRGDGMRVAFDTVTGEMSSWTVAGRELVRTGLAPNFWRAPTDNDLGWRTPVLLAPWREATRNPTLVSIVATPSREGVTVIATHQLQGETGTHRTTYRVSSAAIEIDADFAPAKRDLPVLPRYGLSMTLPRQFTQLSWYGRGPFENYADRKSAATIGRWRSTAWDMVHKYIRPQETGNVTDVRWLALTDASGSGLLVEGAPTFDGSAIQVANADLYYDPDRNRHAADLHPRSFVTLNVDAAQMGVGGDNSWGAKPHDKYMLSAKPYALRMRLVPLRPGEDPGAVWRGRRTGAAVAATPTAAPIAHKSDRHAKSQGKLRK